MHADTSQIWFSGNGQELIYESDNRHGHANMQQALSYISIEAMQLVKIINYKDLRTEFKELS